MEIELRPRPPLCRHTMLTGGVGSREEEVPDFYSLRVDCPACQAITAWLMEAWYASRCIGREPEVLELTSEEFMSRSNELVRNVDRQPYRVVGPNGLRMTVTGVSRDYCPGCHACEPTAEVKED